MRNAVSIALLSFVIMAVITGSSAPAQAVAEPSPALQSSLEARVEGEPGTAIAVGIIDDGKQSMYFAGSTGNARPLDEHTLFEIGSVTKTFTATALAAMSLAHQVKLDDPVAAYLPRDVSVPSKDGTPITLLNLAEQRSGLPRLPTNMDDVAGRDPYADYTRSDMYAFLSSYRLTRDPGSKYEYSNYGIGLLGQALANRAGVTYPALIQRRVLDPLGMTDTTFATMPASDPTAFAVGHDLDGQPVHAWHFRSILPAGGIRSSLADMLKYLRCNMGQGPLAQACLLAQQPRADGAPGHRIGLVWENNVQSGIVSHGGDTEGFHAFVAISKDREKGVVVLSNGPVVGDVAAHVLVPSFSIAACPKTVPASDTQLASYAGVYCNAASGITFTVASGKRRDTLDIALLPQPFATYRRIDADTFSYAPAGATFRFVRENGRVVGLRLLQGGQTIPALRLDASGKPVVTQLPPEFPAAITLDPSTLAQYVGSYAAGSLTFTVTLHGDRLYVQLSGQPAVPVYASAKDRFYYRIVEAQISFGRDAAGKVSSLTLHQNGRDLRAVRSTL